MTPESDLSSLRIERAEAPAPRRSPMLWIFPAIVAVGTAVFLLWLRPGQQGVLVKLTTAEATGGGSLSGEGISANGYVVARTKASVSSKILGRMAWIGVTEGSRVRAGDVIARLESADYEAAVNAARANVAQMEAQLTQARRDLVRAQSLRRDEVLPQGALEQSQTAVDVLAAQLNASRAQVRMAEANFENTRVRAPFDGTVLRKDAEVGEIVAPSGAGGGLTRTAIVTMANLSTLEVEVDVNEAYIAQVKNGQLARITLDAYPDTSFAGNVRQVVPTADRQKATVQVKVAILDRDPRILPEMGAKVVFQAHGAPVAAAPRRVIVPEAAVMQGAAGARVWVVEQGKATSRSVDVGPVRDGRVEIRKGLAGGESLVLNPPATLQDGARVRVAAK